MHGLSSTQKVALRKSSTDAVASAMGRVRKHLAKGHWLGNDNKYSRNTVKKVEKDLASNAANEGQLKQYIAASVLPHCTDGWSFLGRALNAHQNGHSGAALHFAYYAELRAAMSFLATRGIGIFNRRHCVITQPIVKKGHPPGPSCLTVAGRGTHETTWQVLEYWGSVLAFGSARFLLTIVSPAGIPLYDWLEAYVTPVSSRVGQKWLEDWGVDLKQFAEDRELRNQVSYRPSDLSQPNPLSAQTASSFLTDFWTLFEPAAARFDLLDRHILRASLEETFQGRNGRDAIGDAQFAQEIEQMVNVVRPPGPINEWVDFLTRRRQADTARLLSLAGTRSDLQSPDHHLQVISRGALLLRLATGACNSLTKEVVVSKQDLRFWWSSLGLRRGLWDPSSEPVDCSDLWADIFLAIQNERTWQENVGANPSYAQWRNGRSADFSTMGQCERIALWGLEL